jgi:hypothetical protein
MPLQLPEGWKIWARRAVVAVVAVLAVTGVIDIIRFFVSPRTMLLDGAARSVATDWTSSVGRLQVEPVYPPQEDIYVGDIFAKVTRSDDKFTMGNMLADHAIKLWHVDMTNDLRETYADVPVFPPTEPRPTRDGDIWPQKEADDLFAKGGKKALSLVAFPGFSVSHSRAATAGVSTGQGVWGWLSGLLGFTRDDEEVERLLFPAPETYGVNAIAAQAALYDFCSSARTTSFCTEKAVRNMLSMVVGDIIWRTETDPKTQATRYASDVEIMLVRQVFLTRSIVQVHAANSAAGQTALLVAKLKEISDQPASARSTPAAAAPDPNTTANSSASQLSGGPDPIEEQRRKLVELRAMLDSVGQSAPGGSILSLAADGNTIALKQDYPRPIAIGFRTVSQQPANKQIR